MTNLRSHQVTFMSNARVGPCVSTYQKMVAMKPRTQLLILTAVILVCSVMGTWHFGYRYYWVVYYPNHVPVAGSPAYSITEAHL